MIYLSIFLLLLFLSYRYDYCGKEKGRTLWIFIILLIFICLAGLRYRIGTDSIRYETYFVREYAPIQNLSLHDFQNTRYAPFYIILNSLVRAFTDDFMVFQFIHATIVCSVIVWFFAKNSRNVFFALAMFFIYLYLLLLTEVLRESLAVSVFLLAWPFFEGRKWLKWYLMSIVAMLFHTSAVIMFILPIICVPGIRNLFVFGKRTFFICLVIALLAIAVQMMFFRYIQLLAISENLSERAEVYSKSTLGSSGMNAMGIIGQTVRYLLYPIISLYFLNRNMKLVGDNNTIGFKNQESFAIMAIYIGIFSMFIPILARYLNYFYPFAILIVSEFAYDHITLFSKEFRFKLIYWWIFFLPMFIVQFQLAYMHPVNTGKTLKTYMPYYPYASRIEMSRDADREKWFRYQHAW